MHLKGESILLSGESMNGLKTVLSFVTLTGLLLSVGSGSAASKPHWSQSERGRLVHDLVLKWAPYVQKQFKSGSRSWTMEMRPIFAKAPIEGLRRALAQTDFGRMNDALLGQDSLSEMVTQVPTKAFGDADRDLAYVPVTPCRIIDTRVAGGAIAANSTRSFDVTSISSYSGQGGDSSNCNGVGAAGSFAAAAINFTVVTPSAAGYITAFPFQATQPLAATVNYIAGDIRGNFAVVKLDQGPSADELSVYTFAQTHLVADIVGYFVQQDPALSCTNTSVASFTIAANSTNFFNNPTCPSGYSATTPYCWTAASDVFSQGSGYNANATGNSTFCAWQNKTASSQTVFGGNVCCRK